LESQCQYCTDYLVSGIEKICKNYQKALTLFNKMVINEGRNELDDTETTDNTNIGDDDLSLDNNIDLLFENAMNILTNA
ncbi:4131_t:CDS:1, partial [Funneliformis geosporum]